MLAACDSPILSKVDLGNTQVVTTDAKQRAIINNQVSKHSRRGLIVPVRLTCTEPSPDVATAAATSLSTGLSVLGYGSGSFTAQHVEALAQLVERTASIQLLRDKMYQTCLAYTNGAITGTTYSLIMSQLDKTIVSLLLGETAGGAFGRGLAALGTKANGEASATLIGLPAGVEDLAGLTDELKAAQADVTAKEKTAADKKKLAEGKAADSPEATEAKQAEDAAKASVAKRDELLKRVQSRADTLAKSGAEASTVTAGGSLSDRTNPLIASTLREMQEAFLAEGQHDSVVAACLTELAQAPLGTEETDLAALVSESKNTLSRFNPATKDAQTKEDRDTIGTLSKRLIDDIGRRTALAKFCDKNLKDIAKQLMTDSQEIRKLRSQQRLNSATERTKIAESEAAKADSETMKAVSEMQKTCEKIEDTALKKACVGKLPNIEFKNAAVAKVEIAKSEAAKAQAEAVKAQAEAIVNCEKFKETKERTICLGKLPSSK